ncbi:MAG: hypothetical protein RRX93_08040 [Bacteroidales bacterium]
MSNLEKDKKQKESKSIPETSSEEQEEEIKMLITNIESQNLVLDKLTLAIQRSMEQKLNKNTKNH